MTSGKPPNVQHTIGKRYSCIHRLPPLTTADRGEYVRIHVVFSFILVTSLSGCLGSSSPACPRDGSDLTDSANAWFALCRARLELEVDTSRLVVVDEGDGRQQWSWFEASSDPAGEVQLEFMGQVHVNSPRTPIRDLGDVAPLFIQVGQYFSVCGPPDAVLGISTHKKPLYAVYRQVEIETCAQ